MDKKKVAKLFVESFKTTIKEVKTEGQLPGTGQKDYTGGEVIFQNHFQYHKGNFSANFLSFAKKLADEYKVDIDTIRSKSAEKKRYKSFYYQWDPEQYIHIDGVKFRMGRKMMNLPHAILDGVSHTYYIFINDVELVNEIEKYARSSKKLK